MTQSLPIVRGDMLSYQQEGHEQTLVVGSAAWYGWLPTATAFAFDSDSLTFQVRRERAGNKRGGWYWRAYLKRDGKLHRISVGKSEEVTLQRLTAVAAILAAQAQVDADQQEPTRPAESAGDHEQVLQPPTALWWSPAERGAASDLVQRGSSPLPVLLTAENAACIVELCRRLDGLPLANAHLRAIYAKLGVTSRHAAMHYALKQKLV